MRSIAELLRDLPPGTSVSFQRSDVVPAIQIRATRIDNQASPPVRKTQDYFILLRELADYKDQPTGLLALAIDKCILEVQ